MHQLLCQQLAQLHLDQQPTPTTAQWNAFLILVGDTYHAALDEPSVPAPEGSLAHLRHDFKTPLSSIRGFAAAMLEDKEMPADTRTEFLQLVVQESDRLKELIDHHLR